MRLRKKEEMQIWSWAGIRALFFASFFNEEDDREEEDGAMTAGHEHLEMETPPSKSTALKTIIIGSNWRTAPSNPKH